MLAKRIRHSMQVEEFRTFFGVCVCCLRCVQTIEPSLKWKDDGYFSFVFTGYRYLIAISIFLSHHFFSLRGRIFSGSCLGQEITLSLSVWTRSLTSSLVLCSTRLLDLSWIIKTTAERRQRRRKCGSGSAAFKLYRPQRFGLLERQQFFFWYFIYSDLSDIYFLLSLMFSFFFGIGEKNNKIRIKEKSASVHSRRRFHRRFISRTMKAVWIVFWKKKQKSRSERCCSLRGRLSPSSTIFLLVKFSRLWTRIRRGSFIRMATERVERIF